MERFSSKHKIKIVFNIVDVPSSLEGAKTVADVEGNLTVYVNDKIFLNEENILLLELAIILNKWLRYIKNNEFRNFYYESMNYEDQPILEFAINKEKKYSVYSVWQEFKNDDFFDLIELVKAASNYITELKHALQQKFDLNISSFLD